jgi:hypothetical protein
MWLLVLLFETAVLAFSAYQSHDIRAEMRKTSQWLDTPAFDSMTQPSAVSAPNPRADSARDSAVALLGRILADTGLQRSFSEAITGASAAATRALLFAALLLLPLPIAASVVTVRWFWLRRPHQPVVAN